MATPLCLHRKEREKRRLNWTYLIWKKISFGLAERNLYRYFAKLKVLSYHANFSFHIWAISELFNGPRRRVKTSATERQKCVDS
jgi:hypothetical protein